MRPALLGLLALTALLYLWNVTRNGWANDFYAAEVQAGTKSWKAFFFGSFDSSNFITVDKTPASLWVMELSGRIFGKPKPGHDHPTPNGRHPIERDHLRGEAFDPHPPAAHAEPGPAPAVRA